MLKNELGGSLIVVVTQVKCSEDSDRLRASIDGLGAHTNDDMQDSMNPRDDVADISTWTRARNCRCNILNQFDFERI